MSTKKALALVLAVLTLLGVAGAAMAAPKAVIIGAGSSISVGGSTPTGNVPSGSGTQASSAQQGTIANCQSWVSLRKGASSTSTRLARLDKGASVTVLGTSGNYYKISYNGQEGYVSKQYVQLSSGGAGSSSGSASIGGNTQTSTQQGTIANCDEWVSLRKSASSTSTRLAKLNKGTAVTILATNGSYYKVSCNGQEGYVMQQYVQLSSGSSSNGTSSGSSSSGISGGTSSGSSGISTGGSTSSGSSGISGNGVTVSGNGISVGGSTSSSGSSSNTQTSTQQGTIANCDEWVSLRKSASSSASRIARLDKGASVTILGTSGSYYKVSYNGQEGYVSKQYVQLSSGGTGSSSGNNTSSGNVSAPDTSDSETVGAQRYARFTGGSADRWGTIRVDGTSINTYIYCNALDSKGNFRYNELNGDNSYIYAMSYYDDPIAVITGHNKRVSQTGLHQLHHVQNAWLGKSKCDYTKRCSADCSGCKTSIFNINYNGSSRWQLVCFYEIDKSTVSSSSTRKQIMYVNCFNATITGSLKQQWLNNQFAYATSAYRGMKVSNATSSDKLMIIMTCADSSGDSYQRLYMVLKAVD